MPNYLTRLGDAQILLEAPASGAFAKSASEVEADPRSALVNMVRTIKVVCGYLGEEIGPVARKSGATMEISFAVRADSYGLVMVSESTHVGQFSCTVRFSPAPPPRPPGAPGAPPAPAAAPPAAPK
jgi:hypothetical protein